MLCVAAALQGRDKRSARASEVRERAKKSERVMEREACWELGMRDLGSRASARAHSWCAVMSPRVMAAVIANQTEAKLIVARSASSSFDYDEVHRRSRISVPRVKISSGPLNFYSGDGAGAPTGALAPV